MITSHPLSRINSLIFYASLLLLLTSCWHRNDFPPPPAAHQDLIDEPGQHAVDEAPFRVEHNDIEYQIKPRYAYELTGLVVSYEHHDGNYSLHRLWNDHLNVADLCVVWGVNARDIDLNQIDFWNGEFTCNFQTKDAVAWKQFRQDQISNNHLLADNDHIRRMIERIRIGDRIRMRGWLANYSNDHGFSRSTSTSREDRGNGACETIYVQDLTIMSSMDNDWRVLMKIAVAGLMTSSLIWVVAVSRGIF